MFLIFLAAYRDRDYVGAATSSKLTIGTGDQNDAIALALASNMTATDLDVSDCKCPMTPSPPLPVSVDTDLCDVTYTCKDCGATTTRTIKIEK